MSMIFTTNRGNQFPLRGGFNRNYQSDEARRYAGLEYYDFQKPEGVGITGLTFSNVVKSSTSGRSTDDFQHGKVTGVF
jgi:hypothetical protein